MELEALSNFLKKVKLNSLFGWVTNLSIGLQ